jgi:CRISPR-associated endonuclease/helicase Cas3
MGQSGSCQQHRWTSVQPPLGLSPRTGASWTDRVLGLLDRYGPFALAYLEALLRAADQRASRSKVADPLLEIQNHAHGLEKSHRPVAETPAGGADPDSPEPHPPQGRAEHGLRGRAGEPGDAGGGTQAPPSATRHLITSLGILSYAELAPHLALRVQDLEADVAEGRYADRALDEDLIRDLHQRICGDLVPEIAGRWRRVDVRVGQHQAPDYPRVPVLMRDYCLDLQARCVGLSGHIDERVPEFLAFAEGRLLWVHPFADFNGRTTRVLLAELLRRFGLPAIDPTPESGAETERYLGALRAADRADWTPLIARWIDLFAREGQP